MFLASYEKNFTSPDCDQNASEKQNSRTSNTLRHQIPKTFKTPFGF